MDQKEITVVNQMKCVNHLRPACITAQLKKLVRLAVSQGNSPISVVVRLRKWGIAAVNIVGSPPPLPPPQFCDLHTDPCF